MSEIDGGWSSWNYKFQHGTSSNDYNIDFWQKNCDGHHSSKMATHNRYRPKWSELASDPNVNPVAHQIAIIVP